MNKRTIRTSLMIAILCGLISTIVPGHADAGWLTSYYKTHPMTTEQLKASYGEPEHVIAMDNGIEKLIFGPKDVEAGYTYFLTQNGMVIDRGNTYSLGKKPVANINTGPEPKSLMTRYYASHPMTAEELTAKWGAPVKSYEYENGIQKLIYGPKDPEIGYVYFLIKDGMVVDKNCTGN